MEAIGRDLEGGLEARTLLLKDALINGQYDPNLKASLIRHRNESLRGLVKRACQFEQTSRILAAKGLGAAPPASGANAAMT